MTDKIPATWAASESEFELNAGTLLSMKEHRQECPDPACLSNFNLMFWQHQIIREARNDLAALWCSRIKY